MNKFLVGDRVRVVESTLAVLDNGTVGTVEWAAPDGRVFLRVDNHPYPGEEGPMPKDGVPESWGNWPVFAMELEPVTE